MKWVIVLEQISLLTKCSEYLNIDPIKMEKLGVYDGYIFMDSPLYINPKNLSGVLEFKDSEKIIISFFERLIVILKQVKQKNNRDIFWKMANKLFHFPEPEGVFLGTSINSVKGKGLTGKTAEEALKKLKDIVDSGIDDPHIFELLSVIQDNIGVDRVSDMIASILYKEILKYNERILKELGLLETDLKIEMNESLIPKNPNGKKILLMPQSILSAIPIAATYDDIIIVIKENEEIKKYVSEIIGKATKSLLQKQGKEENFKLIVSNKKFISNLVNYVSEKNVASYDFQMDFQGIYKPFDNYKKLIEKNNEFLKIDSSNKNLYEVIGEIINRYKFSIENLGVNEELYYIDSNGREVPKNEITSHRLFIIALEQAKLINSFDYTLEAKASNGRIEFKVVSQNSPEKVLIEFKLNTNKLVHGYKVQLVEYMKRFETNQAYYVIIKVEKNNSIENFHKQIKAYKNNMKVVEIDALKKDSPSTKK